VGHYDGDKARRRFAYVCFAIGALFIVVGMVTVRSFLDWPLQPTDTVVSPTDAIVMR